MRHGVRHHAPKQKPLLQIQETGGAGSQDGFASIDARDDDDRDRVRDRPQYFRGSHRIGVIRPVDHDGIGVEGADRLDRFVEVRRLREYRVAKLPLEAPPQELRGIGVVIYD